MAGKRTFEETIKEYKEKTSALCRAEEEARNKRSKLADDLKEKFKDMPTLYTVGIVGLSFSASGYGVYATKEEAEKHLPTTAEQRLRLCRIFKVAVVVPITPNDAYMLSLMDRMPVSSQFWDTELYREDGIWAK
jgi:hypothetical protein